MVFLVFFRLSLSSLSGGSRYIRVFLVFSVLAVPDNLGCFIVCLVFSGVSGVFWCSLAFSIPDLFDLFCSGGF